MILMTEQIRQAYLLIFILNLDFSFGMLDLATLVIEHIVCQEHIHQLSSDLTKEFSTIDCIIVALPILLATVNYREKGNTFEVYISI